MARKKPARSEAVIAFIECLSVPSGEGAASRLVLRPWQKDFVREVYDPVKANGRRTVRRAILSIARKNGKTALAAALVLVHLCGPEAVPNGEIYSAANDREQAAQVFKFVRQMIELEPDLQAILEVTESRKNIFCPANGSKYQAMSAEAGTKHGLSPTMVIYDELAQTPTGNEDLYDAFNTSFGGRSEPLFLVISTQSHDPEHILSKLIDKGLATNADGSRVDPTTVVHLYAAPDNAEIDDPEAHKAANPGLGDFRDHDDLLALMAEAKAIPAREAPFRNLNLNQRVSPVASLIALKDWQPCLPAVQPSSERESPQFEKGEAVYCGLDLSKKDDLTAYVRVSLERRLVKAMTFKPEVFLHEHWKRDNANYPLWAKQGWLTPLPGRSIAPSAIAEVIARDRRDFDIRGIAFDRWGIDELLRDFDKLGLAAQDGHGDGLRLVSWGQGLKDMNGAVDAFTHAIQEGLIQTDGSPVLTWCVLNTRVFNDFGSDMKKPCKKSSRFRIDASVALMMALGLMARDRPEPKAYNPWVAIPGFSLDMMN